MSAQLVSLSTAVPAIVLDQGDAEAAARAAFGPRFDAFERLAKVFANAGIRQRHVARPLDWYFGTLGWPERTEAFLEVAGDLFVEAASRALEDAGLTAREVDTVVTVCSTGIATPSLEARAAGRLGFRDDVERVPVFGLGCAGGVTGLSIASRLAESRPGSGVGPGSEGLRPQFSVVPLQKHFMGQGLMTGQHHRGRWTDVGTVDRLRALDAELAANG